MDACPYPYPLKANAKVNTVSQIKSFLSKVNLNGVFSLPAYSIQLELNNKIVIFCFYLLPKDKEEFQQLRYYKFI